MYRLMKRKTSLQTIREGKGLTRRTCAEGLGVATHTWKRWEIGYAAPTAASLLDIAAFLEVPAAQLRDITQGTDTRAGTRRTRGASGQGDLDPGAQLDPIPRR